MDHVNGMGDPLTSFMEQDKLVRKAIETDSLVTKELILRKKLLDEHERIPRLKDFPYVVDVEYLCFQKDEEDQYVIAAGQGDLLLTNGHDEYVAVEIKSGYVCFDGSDRVFYSKMAKLIEQVQVYQSYQQKHRPNCKVYGCGVTEQKIYWMDEKDSIQEYWWSSGPQICGPLRLPDTDEINIENVDNLSDDLQALHAMFQDETLARNYPYLVKYDARGRLIYVSKCKQKRVIVSKEHLSQSEIQSLVREMREDGCVGTASGHLVMYGLHRPTIIALYLNV